MSSPEDHFSFGKTATVEDFLPRFKKIRDLYLEAERLLSMHSGSQSVVTSAMTEIAQHYKFVHAYLYQVAGIQYGTPVLMKHHADKPVYHSAHVALNREIAYMRKRLEGIVHKLGGESLLS